MAEEEVVAVASPAPVDHKRKHEDLEQEAPKIPAADSITESKSESEALKKAEEEEEAAAVTNGGPSDSSEAKRPRLEEKPDGFVAENGFQEEKLGETLNDEADKPTTENDDQPEDLQQKAEEVSEIVNDEHPPFADHQLEETQQPLAENSQQESAALQPSTEELQAAESSPQVEITKEVYISSMDQQPTSVPQTTSRKMEVPNNKVGVLIGKAGDTIRSLQINSGAKIQITRDVDADPNSSTRPVELIGTLESINKAEKLIKDVIAEADAGGSPALVARGFSTVQATGTGEQIEIQVPNEKVGLIIGKGGETIKNLQMRSGARIQLIQQQGAEGDQSKERTVRVTGNKRQIEMAREMIEEVMTQPARTSSQSSGYGSQGFRPRGPAVASQWGSRGSHPMQPAGYDYQRGPYQTPSSYTPSQYGGYPSQQVPPRSGFGPGWEHRPPTMQGPPPHSGGYDYYGGHGGHVADAPASGPLPIPVPHGQGPSAASMGPPSSHASHNYGQPQGSDYGQPAPYSHAGPPMQGYGQGYNEVARYESQVPHHHPYGAHGGQQAGAYPQGGSHPGYPQDPYGKPPPSYGMPPQGPSSQSYGQARVPGGDMPYQGPVSTQPYGQHAPQQTYPYASSGLVQQSYPSYVSAPAADGYNQPPAAGSAPVYPQQGSGQPVSGYVQPGGQQPSGYGQVGPAANYGSYPSSQPPSYAEQPAQTNAAYGYQASADQAAYATGAGSAYGVPPAGQAGAYAQPAPTQQGYDQSVQQSGGYGSAAPGGGGPAPVGYGKSVSPQPGYPQYDSAQVYSAHR